MTADYLGKTYTVQGHPGAIRLDLPDADDWEQSGEGTFHQELFAVVEEVMSNNASIEDLFQRLKKKCEEWVWTGDLPNPPLHPRLTLRSGLRVAANVSGTTALQQQRLTAMKQAFDEALARVDADTT